MSLFFYTIFLWLYNAGAYVLSFFDSKARQWKNGRKKIFKKLEEKIPVNEKKIWIHCASLGEFEQGRPVIEKLKARYNNYKILLTFFSPSGYEVQKNYKTADWVFYLPLDGARNANRFLEIVNPDLVIFVKYEYWHYYLNNIKKRGIPLLLISALFKKDMVFFKWYGSLHRKMLSTFNHLFVQNHHSKKLLEKLGLTEKCTVSGDTRFDRVASIAADSIEILEVKKFIGTDKSIVAGSTWLEDEIVLKKALADVNSTNFKLIIAPHEINKKHLYQLKEIFPDSILFSELKHGNKSCSRNILIIDNVGMLSRLYKYATITYVGGGLKSTGVHNVLEAAVYGKPVLFGPFYQQYAEAIGLVNAGGGLPFIDKEKDGRMLSELINALLINEDEYLYRSKSSEDFIQSNLGATAAILNYIQVNRLLTN